MTLPPLWAMTGIGALIVGFSGGWTVRDWKADSDEAKAKDAAFTQYRALSDALADQSLAYEVLAQSLRAGERRDRETIREIYRDRTIPSECAVPADAVGVLSEAVTRANSAAAGEPLRPMP